MNLSTKKGLSIWGGLLMSATASLHAASASENGLTHYPVGVNTILPGILPAPGDTEFYSYTKYYNATSLKGSDGKSIDPSFDLTVAAEAFKLVHTWDQTVGPFSLSSSVIVPFTWVNINAFGRHDSSFGMGDPVISPVYLGYASPDHKFFSFIGLDIYAPLGSYNKDNLANHGLNYWTFSPSINVTYMPTPQWEFSGTALLEFNTENPATNYRSGTDFIFDGAIGYYPMPETVPKLKVSLQGYALQQLSDDTQDGVSVGNRGSSFGVGPQISYDIVPGGGLVLKYQRDFDVRNRAEGNSAWLQFAMPF